MDRAGIEHFHNLGYAKGAALELLRFNHPFYSFDVPVVLGDHVTLDAGTGAVHTAPGHGQEDFVVGQKYGLEVANPVGSNGVYLPDTELFAGQHVFKANAAVVEVLTERGALLHHKAIQPLLYPHCWRHKTPIIFRATPSGSSAWSRRVCGKRALEEIERIETQGIAEHGQSGWVPAWVRTASRRWSRTVRLVYLPSAYLGCPSPCSFTRIPRRCTRNPCA